VKEPDVIDSPQVWLDKTPDLVSLANAFPSSFPYLLDSAASGDLCAHSLLLFADNEVLVKHSTGVIEGPGQGNSFFERLESWYQLETQGFDAHDPGLDSNIPFTGGWFLYLGYELAGEIENTLNLPENPSDLPDAIATRCRGAVIVFHDENRAKAGLPESLIAAETPEILSAIQARLKQHRSSTSKPLPELFHLESEDPEKFKSGVRRVLDYLRDGDAFQVNISRHWSAEFTHAPEVASLYDSLRNNNPAPFAGMMQAGNCVLLSSSPERLVQIRGNKIQTRPIAGTRPRGDDPGHDLELSTELIDNVKERAEHIMLIDLERNDLGRVCKPGTVEVDELMVIESYAHVHHIVSNIKGELCPDASPVDAIMAVFPGGTITGCPKVRCMEIIAELELEGRGFYTGSMGYLGLNGDMDLNILIRSMCLNGQHISFRTGAGIVADSDPDLELLETHDKARGLLLALDHKEGEGAHA
jgi:anthranilate synthase component 1